MLFIRDLCKGPPRDSPDASPGPAAHVQGSGVRLCSRTPQAVRLSLAESGCYGSGLRSAPRPPATHKWPHRGGAVAG